MWYNYSITSRSRSNQSAIRNSLIEPKIVSARWHLHRAPPVDGIVYRIIAGWRRFSGSPPTGGRGCASPSGSTSRVGCYRCQHRSVMTSPSVAPMEPSQSMLIVFDHQQPGRSLGRSAVRPDALGPRRQRTAARPGGPSFGRTDRRTDGRGDWGLSG